jgi:hypothetical protein
MVLFYSPETEVVEVMTMAIALPPVVSSFCATHHRMQSIQNIDNNTSLVHHNFLHSSCKCTCQLVTCILTFHGILTW